MLTKFITRHKLFSGLLLTGVSTLALGGIVLADVISQTTPSQVNTSTITLSYQDILSSPSDGNNGYLVNLIPFPANARITSADMYVKKLFTNTNDPSGQPADPFGTVYLLAVNNPGAVLDVARGDLGSAAGYYIPQNSTSMLTDGIVSTSGELELDVANSASNGSSLSYLNAGKLKIYINYVQYHAP